MTKILSFLEHVEKKEMQDRLARGREPLYISGVDRRPTDDNFGDRLQRIKSSLEKINALMGDLRKESPKVISESADKLNMANKEPT